jgi:hypothetical protein
MHPLLKTSRSMQSEIPQQAAGVRIGGMRVWRREEYLW